MIISCRPDKNIFENESESRKKNWEMLGKIIVTPMKALPYKFYLNKKLKRKC